MDLALAPSKRGRVQEDLAEDGIRSREVEIDAPEGFRAKRVPPPERGPDDDVVARRSAR